MATAERFQIKIVNETNAEVKVKKFEYRDGSTWKTENMFGVDGHQKLEHDHGLTWTRNLGGIGDESTQFRVTYAHHIGGTRWGRNRVACTESFVAHDNDKRTVTLTD